MSITKLRLLRESKNWLQEDVAIKLGIKQTAYSKIELGTTQLTIDRINKLAKIFEVEPEYFLNNDIPFVNNNNGTHSKAVINPHNYYETQKELVEELLKSKDAQIKLLSATVENFNKEREKILLLLEKLSDKISK
jgi:transcriptional regulator with XRE-family HTH domain